MRGIHICLDGLIAFLAAAVLADALMVGLAFFSLRSLIQARRNRERFSRHPLYPHVVGMSVSLAGCVAVMLFMWLSIWTLRPHPLVIWLDDFVLLWTVSVLALWPVISCAIKWRSKRKTLPPRSGT